MSTTTQKIDNILESQATGTPLAVMREKRRQLGGVLNTILAVPAAEKRNLLASESRDFDYAKSKINGIDDRIAELENDEKRTAAAATAVVATGEIGEQRWHHTAGGETYHRGTDSPSFFRDLRHAQLGDLDAADRLRRNNQETEMEKRALGNTGAAGGSGGEFAPPGWIIEDFVKLARPGRVTADLFHSEPLPTGVASVNIPKVTAGTTTAVQSTQNTSLSQTDLTSSSLSSNVVTIGGKEVVSQQLLDQSGVPFDRIVLEDLAADYAKQLGKQVLTGSGTSGQLKGYLTATSTNSQTWTQASPTPALFYSQLGKLQAAINTSRFAPADAIVMTPTRWAWMASYTDTTGRPLVVPTAGGFNSLASPDAPVAAGKVGSILGVDVYTDPNIPTNLGAGTNQDAVLMFRRDDIWLWESALRAETFTAPYADSLGVLFRVYAYSAMIPDRYASTLGQLGGTGLVTPTFAG